MRILIVDDCPMARLALRTMLESVGYAVSEADDGDRIVGASGGPVKADLVLCDIFMPGRDGLEVTKELRRTVPGIKIIAISGGSLNGKMDLLPVALRLGADEILYKPIDEKTLLKTVSQVMRKPAGELADASKKLLPKAACATMWDA
jgi:two-component system chemotaxis response regulator CheY